MNLTEFISEMADNGLYGNTPDYFKNNKMKEEPCIRKDPNGGVYIPVPDNFYVNSFVKKTDGSIDVCIKKKDTTIFDRVKTFEDAERELGFPYNQVLRRQEAPELQAFQKLLFICRALNEGWVSTFDGTSVYMVEYDYHSGKLNASAWSHTQKTNRFLFFKSKELAEHTIKHFPDLWKTFLGVNDKP